MNIEEQLRELKRSASHDLEFHALQLVRGDLFNPLDNSNALTGSALQHLRRAAQAYGQVTAYTIALDRLAELSPIKPLNTKTKKAKTP